MLPKRMLPKRMSLEEWNEFVDTGNFEDISEELPDSFLVYGQIMRGMILYENQKYYCTGWKAPRDPPYVELKLVMEEKCQV